MTEDVDMDAPQISTLREDTTPEPNPARSKFRVKLLVGDKGEGSKASSVSSKHGRGDSDDEDEDEEDDEEEDQLIDDDDEEVARPARAIPPQVTAPPRGSPGRRAGRGRGGGRRGRGGGRAGAPVLAPGMIGLEPTSLEVISAPEIRAEVLDPNVAASGSALSQPTGRKKPGPPKGSTQRGARKKASKPSVKGTVNILKDADAESVSEAYAGTAASSPAPHDGSPEPDIPLSSIIPHPHPIIDDAPLDGVPLPVYPLPSKPFPVQPPPKIGTGFAPVIPLDKSGKHVRKWRQVNREVRGIAGGRWFVRSWVGEKESEFAAAVAASQAAAQSAAADGLSAAGLSLPKLSSVSISGTGRGRGRGARHNVADHASTVASSRAGSALPDSISAQLSKKRGSGPSTPSLDIPVVSVPVVPLPAAP
ncbi:hypothetical protein BD310DRAFT_974710 [Dichomitus squalens]|uniref:Uncharacterized protein n=1 Tax=Dichomitus squalens TaxID=114155 RepID=A0A4Q9Q5E7_9APHY|nr:hypothetical protein BD310DRAFT_974710 [Dichomitus squalens]